MPAEVDDSGWRLLACVLLARLPGGSARVSADEIRMAARHRIVIVNGELRLELENDEEDR